MATPIAPAPTRARFLKLRKQGKIGGDVKFKNWQSYVQTQQTKRTATAPDPAGAAAAQQFGAGFFTTPPSQLLAQAMMLYPNDPSLGALSGKQIQSQAQQMVQPMFQGPIDWIKKMYADRSTQGSAAMKAATDAYVQAMGEQSSQVAGIYDQAIAQSQGTNAALADFVRNSGASLGAELAAKGAQAGIAAPAAQDVAATGVAASNASAAGGAAASNALLNADAAEAAYGAKLPGYARGYGLQQLGSFQSGLTNQMNEQVGGLMSQLPGTISQAVQALQDRELQKAGLRTTRQQNIGDFYKSGIMRNVESSIAGAQLMQNARQFMSDDEYRRFALATQVSEAAKGRAFDAQQNALTRKAAKDARIANDPKNKSWQERFSDDFGLWQQEALALTSSGTIEVVNPDTGQKETRVTAPKVGNKNQWQKFNESMKAMLKRRYPKAPQALINTWSRQLAQSMQLAPQSQTAAVTSMNQGFDWSQLNPWMTGQYYGGVPLMPGYQTPDSSGAARAPNITNPFWPF